MELSQKTRRLVAIVFPTERLRLTAEEKLIKDCGNRIPFCDNSSPQQMERIRFSVLKLSQGDLRMLDDAIKLANVDWRDLFMAADFGLDANAHERWYEQMVTEE